MNTKYTLFSHKQTAKDVKNWWREKVLKCIRDVICINQAITASDRYFNHWSLFGWAQVQWDEPSLARTGIVYMWNKNVYYQLQIFTVKLVCFTGTVKKAELKSFASLTFFSPTLKINIFDHGSCMPFFSVFSLCYFLWYLMAAALRVSLNFVVDVDLVKQTLQLPERKC